METQAPHDDYVLICRKKDRGQKYDIKNSLDAAQKNKTISSTIAFSFVGVLCSYVVTVGNGGWQVPRQDAAPGCRMKQRVGVVVDDLQNPMLGHVDAKDESVQKEVDHIGLPGAHEQDFRDLVHQQGSRRVGDVAPQV